MKILTLVDSSRATKSDGSGEQVCATRASAVLPIFPGAASDFGRVHLFFAMEGRQVTTQFAIEFTVLGGPRLLVIFQQAERLTDDFAGRSDLLDATWG